MGFAVTGEKAKRKKSRMAHARKFRWIGMTAQEQQMAEAAEAVVEKSTTENQLSAVTKAALQAWKIAAPCTPTSAKHKVRVQSVPHTRNPHIFT